KQKYEGGSPTVSLQNAAECAIDNGLDADTNLLEFFGVLETCQNSLFTYNDVTEDYSVSRYGVTVVQPLVRMDRWYRYNRAQSLDNGAKAELAHAQQELMIRSAE